MNYLYPTLRFARGFSNPFTANYGQSGRLGKLRPVKERNRRICRWQSCHQAARKTCTGPADIFPLSYRWRGRKNHHDLTTEAMGRAACLGGEGGAPTPSAMSASSRTESSEAKHVGQLRAGCLAHHVVQLKDSQVLMRSD